MFRSIVIPASLFALICFAISVNAQDEPVEIKVESRLVIVNAYITDIYGNPARGLKREDFSILENGVIQDVNFFSPEDTPYAAVILLDTSGSMEGRITLARSAAINFLDGLRIEDNAAIYRFASKVEQIQDFSNSRDINDRIFDLRSDGMTALYDAIYLASETLSRRVEKRRAIIVLSDGEDTFSGKNADKALKAALAANAVIYTVDMSPTNARGAGIIRNRAVLKNFAEKSGGRYVSTPGGNALREAFGQIAAELGTQYTITYEPLKTKMDGKWKGIEVRVAKPNLIIRTRKGYNAEKKK